ncbi:hypothetical protein X759_34135 [Mesorhizobium sp. LSHC420B00]|nr:hypothetical protein X759_34135 [Mesorhizobium sp. LSHC420B00]
MADGFYEFTDPEDPKKKRKDKWLFAKKDEPIFCIAGIWREMPEVGEGAQGHRRSACLLLQTVTNAP